MNERKYIPIYTYLTVYSVMSRTNNGTILIINSHYINNRYNKRYKENDIIKNIIDKVMIVYTNE